MGVTRRGEVVAVVGDTGDQPSVRWRAGTSETSGDSGLGVSASGQRAWGPRGRTEPDQEARAGAPLRLFRDCGLLRLSQPRARPLSAPQYFLQPSGTGLYNLESPPAQPTQKHTFPMTRVFAAPRPPSGRGRKLFSRDYVLLKAAQPGGNSGDDRGGGR